VEGTKPKQVLVASAEVLAKTNKGKLNLHQPNNANV
jgi:hypothetical protein